MTTKTIQLGKQEISCQTDETVLDVLLREQVEVSYSCKQGVGQSCLSRSLDAAPPPVAAQHGLKDILQQQNYFLACLYYPEQDMRISLSDHAAFSTHVTIIEKKKLNEEVILYKVKTDQPIDYYAGQFVNLQRDDGLSRSYSIANSRSQSKHLSFHIRRLAGGKFSEWAHQELKLGDRLAVPEPQGLCYYPPISKPEQNMSLIGTGSGLAPLAGIISEALHQGHQGEIYLYHGNRDLNGLYWIEEMQQLMTEYPNFHYTPCISNGEPPKGIAKGLLVMSLYKNYWI